MTSSNLVTRSQWLRTIRTLEKEELELRATSPSWGTGPVDLLSVSKWANREQTHNNVIAWLLSPYGRHGMGVRFLRYFLEEVGVGHGLSDETLEGTVVEREVKGKESIQDIVIYLCNGETVVIETKVHSGERPGQWDDIVEDFAGRKKVRFVFLTLKQGEPQSLKRHKIHIECISFQSISRALKKCLDEYESKRRSLEPQPLGLETIRNYYSTLLDELMVSDQFFQPKTSIPIPGDMARFYLKNEVQINDLFKKISPVARGGAGANSASLELPDSDIRRIKQWRNLRSEIPSIVRTLGRSIMDEKRLKAGLGKDIEIFCHSESSSPKILLLKPSWRQSKGEVVDHPEVAIGVEWQEPSYTFEEAYMVGVFFPSYETDFGGSLSKNKNGKKLFELLKGKNGYRHTKWWPAHRRARPSGDYWNNLESLRESIFKLLHEEWQAHSGDIDRLIGRN